VITIRLSEPAARRLRAHARSRGLTPSALVRDLLAREIGDDGEGTVLERTRSWIGAIHDPQIAAGRDAHGALDEWDPDRRR
jgi:hypothetical protein